MARAGRIAEKRAPLGSGALGGLGFLLLGEMLGHPSMGGELGEASHGPSGGELGEDVLEVGLGIQAEEDAIVDEGIGDGEALSSAPRAGEEKAASPDGKGADASLGAPVVDLEAAVVEGSPDEVPLILRVLGGLAERRFGQKSGVHVIDPAIELVEERDGACAPDVAAGGGVEDLH